MKETHYSFKSILKYAEDKCKLDYVLSPYTKTVLYTSALYCYSTPPLGLSTEIETYHDRQKCPSLYMISVMYGTEDKWERNEHRSY